MLTLLSYAMTVQSAYVAINTPRSDLFEAYDKVQKEYGPWLQKAVVKVVSEYDKSVQGFYINA